MHYFTSITANYLPKARVLASSIKRHHPDAIFHLVLCDVIPEEISVEREPFDSILLVEDLGIPDLKSWIFKHSVVELCTAVKGQSFLTIFNTTNAEKLIYFDPDIVVLDRLEELERLLDTHSVIVTPHQVEPDNSHEAIVDNEICSLKHGIYNLGFLAVHRDAGGIRFLEWWRDRLLNYCYDDIPNGLFTDQRWVDLAPALFGNIHILREKTYNVATWNLSHRLVKSDRGQLQIHGNNIKFFHFSGFDSGAQEIMLKKYAEDNEALFDLRKWYIAELEKMEQGSYGDLSCIFSFYSNGETIAHSHRILYRSRKDLIAAFPDPFRVDKRKKCYLKWLAHKQLLTDPEATADHAMNDLQQQLTAIMNSWSWRITSPLRWLKHNAKQIL